MNTPTARAHPVGFLVSPPLPLLTLLLLLAATLAARAQDPSLRFGGPIPPEVDGIYERGLAYLAKAQDATGQWKGSNEGAGVDGICLMAFLASGEDPNYGRYAGTIRAGVRAIIQRQQDNNGYLPSSMYHHGFGMLALAEAYGAVDENLLWTGAGAKGRSIAETLKRAVALAATAQKRSRWGGWRYSPEAVDADTSVTGAVLMGLFAVRNAGLEVPDEVINTAMEYMRRSTGKDGSVAYTGGFGGGMGGSMNLTAISVLVGAVSRTKDTEQYKASLKRLTENLEQPESYHREYFRYYAAQALFQGDYDAFQKWNAATVKTIQSQQLDDGSFQGGAYGTGMTLLALALNYRFLPIYER